MTGDSSVGIDDLERRLRGGEVQALAELFSRERERLWRVIQFRLADALIRRNQPVEACAELQTTMASLQQQSERQPALAPPHDLLALGYSRLAIALRATGENERAEEAARMAEQARNAGRRAP
jgi:chaperone required for assembly of F1-ATPase